jgi:hypothetical protein
MAIKKPVYRIGSSHSKAELKSKETSGAKSTR